MVTIVYSVGDPGNTYPGWPQPPWKTWPYKPPKEDPPPYHIYQMNTEVLYRILVLLENIDKRLEKMEKNDGEDEEKEYKPMFKGDDPAEGG